MNSLLLPEVQNVLERLHDLADARDETMIQQVRGNAAVWNAKSGNGGYNAFLEQSMHHLKVSCVIWTLLLLPAGVAGAETPVDFPVSAAPYLAVYRWGAANKNGGAAANEAYARWLGRAVVWAEDFEPTERWDSLEGGGWQLREWSRWKKGAVGRRLILSVPLLPGGWDRRGPRQGDAVGKPVSLSAGARGEYNARFKKLAENLVHYGLGANRSAGHSTQT